MIEKSFEGRLTAASQVGDICLVFRLTDHMQTEKEGNEIQVFSWAF